MNNAKLIKVLRETDFGYVCEHCEHEDMCRNNDCVIIQTADALEAAEKRIAELEDDLRNGTISNPERFKIYGYTVKDLLLFAELCKRNDIQEADMKQAAWNLELAVRAVMNERQEIIENEMKQITMRFTPDFEKAYEEMMPNCGARMDGKENG